MGTKSENLPNNIKIHIPIKVCMLIVIHMLIVEKKNSPFDLDVMQIKQCDFLATPVILIKTLPEHHFDMHSNVKQDFIDYS